MFSDFEHNFNPDTYSDDLSEQIRKRKSMGQPYQDLLHELNLWTAYQNEVPVVPYQPDHQVSSTKQNPLEEEGASRLSGNFQKHFPVYSFHSKVLGTNPTVLNQKGEIFRVDQPNVFDGGKFIPESTLKKSLRPVRGGKLILSPDTVESIWRREK